MPIYAELRVKEDASPSPDTVRCAGENPELYACAEAVARSMPGELVPENVSPGIQARRRLSRMIADSAAWSKRSTLLDALGSFEGDPAGYDVLVDSVRVTFLAAITSNQRACSNAVNTLLVAAAVT